MGWAVSTVEAEAFKALAIVKENPPSTLCSMAVIYARASKQVPYGSSICYIIEMKVHNPWDHQDGKAVTARIRSNAGI